jgi:hypothetical protein
VNFTFYQLLIREQQVFMRPYIVIYPGMVEIERYGT